MLLQCVVSNEVITVRCIFKLLLVFLKIVTLRVIEMRLSSSTQNLQYD